MSCQGCLYRCVGCHNPDTCENWAAQVAMFERRRHDRALEVISKVDTRIKYGSDACRKRNKHMTIGRQL
jgi:pyruvate-formate lyase-activating enzyme